MSTVFLARSQRFSQVARTCAIEVVRASDDLTARKLQHTPFEREAVFLTTLRHPAIPQVYDSFVERCGCCLLLELVPGEGLERCLARTGQPVIASLLIDWSLWLLDVLSYPHTQQPQPIVFREPEPSNVMLRPDNTLRLIDSDIARQFQPLYCDTVVGTVGYAPSERYRGIIDPDGGLSAL